MPGIVGLGRACEIALASLVEEGDRLELLRSSLFNRIVSQLDGCVMNGCDQERLPSHLSLSFSRVSGTELISDLREVDPSSGAACSSDTPVPSHILSAMGRSDAEAQSILRFGLGPFSSRLEVDYAASQLIDLAERLRVGGRNNDTDYYIDKTVAI